MGRGVGSVGAGAGGKRAAESSAPAGVWGVTTPARRVGGEQSLRLPFSMRPQKYEPQAMNFWLDECMRARSA